MQQTTLQAEQLILAFWSIINIAVLALTIQRWKAASRHAMSSIELAKEATVLSRNCIIALGEADNAIENFLALEKARNLEAEARIIQDIARNN